MSRLSDFLPTFQDMVVGARFLWRLPSFLRNPLRLDQAQAILRQRLEQRESDFLDLARRGIFSNPRSPYRGLLSSAGCEYGDLERLVRQQGLEGALGTLLLKGIYLTGDEFKGRHPVVRGSASLAVRPEQLRNPAATIHLLGQTSGSRGARLDVPIDLASVWDDAVGRYLAYEAHGGSGWVHAFWGVPGGSGIKAILRYAVFGTPTVRWFTQIEPDAAGLHPRYRWSVRLMCWASHLARVPLPRPEYVPIDDPLPIACWMAEVLRSGRTPHLSTSVSAAVRLCQSALEAGLDVSGGQFTLHGEALTATRLAVLRRAGTHPVSSYSSTESGPVAYGCLAPQAPDDLHFMHDRLALIQPATDAMPELPPLALLVSSLRPTARFLLLNVSLGDQAQMVRRTCGCPLERLGWITHLHTIRSFAKVTAGGMTLPDSEVARVLEEVLPAHFGGGPTDYQLVEEDGADGQPVLRLLVHPSIGPLDDEPIGDTFLNAMGEGLGAERVMELQWRRAGLLRVERRPPLVTPSGKVLHFYRVASADGAAAH